ncbi:MAG TPA: CotH kinase family protein [bacterium]|nr:CotH kinase family protein [bacterium]HPN43342.1 CotH kinase family protein [bacterium]
MISLNYRKRLLLLQVIGWAFFLIAANAYTFPPAEAPSSSQPDFLLVNAEQFSSNLPIIVIDTYGQTIVDPYRIEADMGIIYNGPGNRNYLTDPYNDYNGQIGIELRGSTALQFPKQPYRLETHDSLGQDINVSLLGMPIDNDWVLHNPYSDKTFIRNVLAYKIANDLGQYASRSRLCELFLNGQYEGVYVLLEKIKRDKNRVNIADLDSTDLDGDKVTGGYILKIDKTEGEQLGGWRSANNVNYQYHYPAPDEIMPQQEQYIQNYMSRFEQLVLSPGYADPDTGYTSMVDLNSFVDFFLVNEISRNIDGYRLSSFMYKNRDDKDGRLKMGPVWDFNLAFGNANYYYGWGTQGWNLQLLIDNTQGDFEVPFWWGIIANDAAFQNLLAQRWVELRANELKTETLLEFIDAMADTLAEAQVRNYKRWPEALGNYVWPNFMCGYYYEEEIEFLKEWLTERLRWMDSMIILPELKSDIELNSTIVPVAFSLAQNYPNPFNSQTVIEFSLDKSSFTSIEIFNLLGQKVKTLVQSSLAAGKHRIVWNGINDSGKAITAGIYTYRIHSDSGVLYKKMVFVE